MLEDNISMVFNDILRISQERKIDMRTAASIIAVGRVAIAELSKEIVNMMIISSSSPLYGVLAYRAKGGSGDYMTEETLNTLQSYLTYLCDDLMKRIPLDYWTLVVLISNLERVLNTSKIIGGDIGVIVKDIYTEAVSLFSSFVKAKPENGDLLTATSALPESARKQL
jgi:hypothetical protein